MKILVTGARGMVGHAIQEVFKDYKLTLTDIESLDIRYWQDCSSYMSKWDLIIHLAAETDLEFCQKEPFLAYMTNLTGTANMVKMARILDCPIVYISTAGIFDGAKDWFSDNDFANPVNHYGRSKLYGEMHCTSYWKHYIFRAGWMMGGGSEIDKKFVNKIIKKIKAGHQTINVINDVYGSPTYTFDLAKTIRWAIDEKIKYGIYNCSGEGRVSRYGVAKKIVEILGLSKQVTIVPIKSAQIKQEFPCPRSKCEVLENEKLNNINEKPVMRKWDIALEEYLKKDFMK